MDKELINVFKPIFDEDPALGRLLTGTDKVIGFEELCVQGYIVDDDEPCLDSLGSTRFCVICVSEEGDSLEDKCIFVDIFCLHEYLFNGEKKLRPYEIASHINRFISHKAKFSEGIPEMGSFRAQPLSNEIEVFCLTYQFRDTQLPGDGDLDFFEYYEKHLFDVLEGVFSSDDIKKQLVIHGVSADGIPFMGLLEKRYIRISADLDCDKEEDNVFAIIRFESEKEMTLGVDVIGSAGENGTGAQTIKARAKELSEMIDQKMLSVSGIRRSSYDGNELYESVYMFSRSYLISKTEEEVKKAEFEKKIKVGFIADMDVLQKISETELKDDNTEVGFSLDLIQAPMHFVFSNKDCLEYRFYIRNEIASYEKPDFGVRIYGNDSEPEIEVNKNFTEDSAEYFSLFMDCMLSLAKYIQAHGIMQQFSSMDMNRETVLLYLDGEDVKYKLLREKERPDLMCSTMFGENVMMRPYQNEMVFSWVNELMSFEDKLEAAENGDADMMEQVAQAYFTGEDVTEEIDTDSEKAVYWMERAAENGSARAMFNIGLCYAKGYGVERDFEKAADWMEQASEAGDTDAYDVSKRYRAAAEAKKKAEAGDPQGQGDYAAALMGIGGSLSQADSDADYAESIQWAKKAEGRDNGEASFVLGLAYEHGRGVKPDMHKAFKYYKRGADKGHAICMNNMGLMCQNGEGTQKNEKKAFELFLQAAEKGYGLAMQNVGQCYQYELGTDFDMGKAIEWYEKSLEILPDPELAQKVEIFKELEAQEAPE